MPFKHNAARRHRIGKMKFKVALVRGYEIERISIFDVVGYACLT